MLFHLMSFHHQFALKLRTEFPNSACTYRSDFLSIEFPAYGQLHSANICMKNRAKSHLAILQR